MEVYNMEIVTSVPIEIQREEGGKIALTYDPKEF
jgi:hypothetical protein